MHISLMLRVAALMLVPGFLQMTARAELEDIFRNPPAAAKPWVYWFWINGNITREGITADLEAIAHAGIGGVLIMEVARPKNMAPPGPVAFAGEEWRELFRHVVIEARRLKIQVSMNNDAGWCGSGGPWITPELSMQDLVMTSTSVSGPQRLQKILSRPLGRRDYYREVKVLAFPSADKDQKDVIPPDQVLDLTSQMDATGDLTWDVPEGSWTILRLGVTTTGRMNRPPPASGLGLECDKFDADAVKFHFESFLAKLTDDNAGETGSVFTMTHIDSWEVGKQDWTSGMVNEFRKRRGYDLLHWLPALAGGAIIGSPEQTDRFRWDFDRTLSELTDEEYAGGLRKAAASRGLKLSIEAYGGHAGFLNPLTYGAEADLPMAEFWIGRWEAWHLQSARLMASVGHVYGKPIIGAESFTSAADNDPFSEHPYTVKSTGDWAFSQGINRHVFHRSVLNPWPQLVPGMGFAAFGWHADRTQTWWNNGGTAFFQYLARCQALLQEGQAVVDVCRLLHDGENYGHLPAMSTLSDLFDPVPAGYKYDYISDKALLKLVSVKDGRLVTPSGMSYSVLQLPNATTMTVELVARLHDLVKSGAVITGPRPERAPGLSGYPKCDSEVRAYAAKIWGDCDGTSITEHRLGRGRVIWGRPLADVLAQITRGADLEFVLHPPCTQESLHLIQHGRGYGKPREKVGTMPTSGINWIHRRTDDAELYFLANPQYRNMEALVTFRTRGTQPELWDPSSGDIRDLPVFRDSEKGTHIPLHFDSAASMFVIFRRKANPRMQVVEIQREGAQLFGERQPLTPGIPDIRSTGSLLTLSKGTGRYSLLFADGRRETVEASDSTQPVAVPSSWNVSFQQNRGAPAETQFVTLSDWTASSDPGIRYFSGMATYRTVIDIPITTAKNARRYLDLGDVHVVAEVTLNGKALGTLWKPPFRTDVTETLRHGCNELEVRVTNLWPNRLIGDEQYPDDCTPQGSWKKGPIPAWPDWLTKNQPRPEQRRITFTTWKHFTKDQALLPSGLLGPVRIFTEPEYVARAAE